MPGGLSLYSDGSSLSRGQLRSLFEQDLQTEWTENGVNLKVSMFNIMETVYCHRNCLMSWKLSTVMETVDCHGNCLLSWKLSTVMGRVQFYWKSLMSQENICLTVFYFPFKKFNGFRTIFCINLYSIGQVS